MVNRNKSIAKKSANEASDSDFYIKKVYEPFRLSFSIEKQKKLYTRKSNLQRYFTFFNTFYIMYKQIVHNNLDLLFHIGSIFPGTYGFFSI